MNKRNCPAPGCAKASRKLGWCDMHYWRVKHHGNPGPGHSTRGISPYERVDKDGPGGCWLWTGPTNEKGYGRLSIGHRGNWAAHRYFYTQIVGPIPDGLVLDHLCRVRNCVNPAHLEPVTNAENLLRGRAARQQGR